MSTRMHSSGMHTARLLTAPQHVLHGEGCIPAWTWGVFQHALPRAGCVSQHALGVSIRACTDQRVYPSMHCLGVYPSMHCLWEVSAPGCLPGGVSQHELLGVYPSIHCLGGVCQGGCLSRVVSALGCLPVGWMSNQGVGW